MKTETNSQNLSKGPIHILKDVYFARKEKNPSYSLQSFARDLGISKSFLSRIFSGERRLSMQLAVQVSSALGFNETQSRSLLLSVINTSPKPTKTSQKLKARLEQELEQGPDVESETLMYTTVEIERFKAMASWYHLAILNLVIIKGIKTDPMSIAKKLGISTFEAREAIERMIALGLLHEKKERLARSSMNLYIKTQKSEFAVRNFHEQMINKAKDELKKTSEADFNCRLINGITFACGKDQIELIKEKIDQFQDEILRIAAGGDKEELYQMNVQYFPLTKKDNSGV